MSAARKYIFDVEFDEHGRIVNPVEEEQVREEPEDLPPPEATFSKAELEQARAEGHAAGREEMRTEAEAATETAAALALDTVAERIAGLAGAQRDAVEELRRESVAMALAVARKMFPTLARRNALPEIESVIHSCLREYITEPRIFVRVHQDVLDLVKASITPLVERTGFRGDLVVVAEPDLGRSDCVLEWGAGGAERRTEWLWQNIDREVADSLGVAVDELEAFPWGGRGAPASGSAAPTRAEAGTEIEGDAGAGDAPVAETAPETASPAAPDMASDMASDMAPDTGPEAPEPEILDPEDSEDPQAKE
ncbi:MAG: FliH/SctL family protein [Acetobacterales bacterium]